MQKVCSPSCALKHARAQTEKKQAKEQAQERKAIKAKLQAMQTKPQLVKKAQTAFNAFIRARDAGKPCISCGRPLGTEPNTYDCGHYRSVGSAPHMRFVEDNAHGQCKHCNNHLAGNHVEYRKGLIERIGPRAVELIEADSTLRKYTHEGLIEIARHYREQARKLGGKA
ncbi:recombination protein NinG [Hydrogenophaga aquatica]